MVMHDIDHFRSSIFIYFSICVSHRGSLVEPAAGPPGAPTPPPRQRWRPRSPALRAAAAPPTAAEPEGRTPSGEEEEIGPQLAENLVSVIWGLRFSNFGALD